MNIQTTGWESDDVDDIFGCAGGVGANYVTNILKCVAPYGGASIAVTGSWEVGAAYLGKKWSDRNEGLGYCNQDTAMGPTSKLSLSSNF